ncbi:hypothetical protein COV15_02275 [Candidatus Woesearchaeota archaeon CG10_big_fil_rev_8_21_14_0_10_34_12]|nr:MAG: hypothetical protein COV15_02275 [Candidatus Woesearchaeota archaeon CG10_big_fil_rev_8_21_14_0_10_34_12]
MKKSIVIILLILVVIILVTAIYLACTYKQAKEILKIINDNSIQEDFQQLMAGDCGKLSAVENNFADIKTKLTSACKNPVLKAVIERSSERDICNEINNQSNSLDSSLSNMHDFCTIQ